MKQSRAMSFAETAINTGSGFGISLLAQSIVLPMLGVAVTLPQNVAFAIVMTFVSIARGYLLRRLFEALHIRRPLSPGALAILAERDRQVEVEGWTAEHDEAHAACELACAGAAYAQRAGRWMPTMLPPACWPWSLDWWKPTGFRRDLVKAGALILAEIERHDRNRRRSPQVTRTILPNENGSNAPRADLGVTSLDQQRLAHGKTRDRHSGTSE